MIIWERIKALREGRNLSQTQLAVAMQVSKQSVSNWENNNILPSVELLEKLSRFFGVSTDYLLGCDDRIFLEVSGLSLAERDHLQLIINDLLRHKQ